jgi:CRP/FNR family cyclic AMP-dependent transcriptional regulator
VTCGGGSPDRGFAAILGPRQWTALCGAGNIRSYRRGQTLLRQGERGGFVLAVMVGRLRIAALAPDGGQLLHALRGDGDLVGEMGLRSEARRTATVVALDDCTACHLSDAAFQRFLVAERAHDALREYLIAKLSETVPYQLQLVHFTPRQRIARLLIDVIALAGSQSDPLRIPFTQTGIADALGLARSTVAGQIAALRAADVLVRGRQLVVRDLPRLTRLAGISGDPDEEL